MAASLNILVIRSSRRLTVDEKRVHTCAAQLELDFSIEVSSVLGVSNVPAGPCCCLQLLLLSCCCSSQLLWAILLLLHPSCCWLSCCCWCTCSRHVILLLLSPCSCCTLKKTFDTIISDYDYRTSNFFCYRIIDY